MSNKPEKRPVEDWKDMIYPALQSKQREIQLVGYQEITIDEIWDCLEHTTWKKKPSRRLYEVVQDVFHLSASALMNYMTANALKAEKDDLIATIQEVTGENK